MKNTKTLIALVLFLATIVVFIPLAKAPFINYDDPAYITANPIVQTGFTYSGLKWAFSEVHAEHTYWHPVTWMSHMFDCQIFGLNPAGHHLMNLLFHSINTVLLFIVLNQFTGALWRSALVSVLFGLHPLQVDTVAWVTERKNLLGGLFWLLAMWTYGVYVRRGIGRTWYYCLAVIAFVFGLMSKPILVTWPFAMLVLDFWPLKRFGWRGNDALTVAQWRDALPTLRKLSVEKLPFVVLAVVSSLITVRAHDELGMTGVHGLSIWLRMENAFVSYMQYIENVFWPHNLAVLYPHPGEWPDSLATVAILLCVGITAWVAFAVRKRPHLTVGWLWFIGVLVPTIGIVQVGVQARADRFMYLPIIGLLVGTVWEANEFFGKYKTKRHVRYVVGLVPAVTCAFLTSHQLAYWKDGATVFQHAVQVTQDNYSMHSNLAGELIRRKEWRKAEVHAREALRIRPGFFQASYHLGMCEENNENIAAAFACYNEVIRYKDDGSGVVPQSHARMAALLLTQGRTQESIAHYRLALSYQPHPPEILNNLAWILASCPEDELRNGGEAVRYAEEACSITHSTNALFLGTLGAAYAEASRFSEAVGSAERAALVATKFGDTQLAATNRALAMVYKAGRTFRNR